MLDIDVYFTMQMSLDWYLPGKYFSVHKEKQFENNEKTEKA